MTSGKSEIRLGFEHSYAENLPGFYVSVKPAPAPRPRLLQFNSALADELGLDVQNLNEAFQKLLHDVQRSLDNANRERFTQKLVTFRVAVRGFLTL